MSTSAFVDRISRWLPNRLLRDRWIQRSTAALVVVLARRCWKPTYEKAYAARFFLQMARHSCWREKGLTHDLKIEWPLGTVRDFE